MEPDNIKEENFGVAEDVKRYDNDTGARQHTRHRNNER